MNSNSALDKLIESTSNHWPILTPKARAELAQLRATVAAQAKQLEQAREIIELASATKTFAFHDDASAWLSANAPAPQAQPQEEQSA